MPKYTKNIYPADIEMMFDSYIQTTIRNARRDYDRRRQRISENEVLMNDFQDVVSFPGHENMETEQLCLSDIFESFDRIPEKGIRNIEYTFTDEILLKAVRNLTDRQKVVLYMRYVFNKSVPFIAYKLGISETAVKKLNRKAIENIVKCYGTHHPVKKHCI